MKNNQVECSVVVPVYNSEDCIEELCSRLKEAFNSMETSHEVILVNDASRDNSWQKIVALAKKDKNIKAINLRKNFGQDSAIMSGLNNCNGSAVIIMDDDLQHDPADIPNLLAELKKGYDVVYARFAEKKQKLWKNLGSWFNGIFANIVIKKPRHIYLSPFKAIDRKVVDEIINYNGPFPYIDGLLFRVTDNISQKDAEHYERFAGKTNYNLWKSIRVWLSLATNFSVIPLRLATFLGLSFSLFGFVLALAFFIYKLVHPQIPFEEMPVGWTSLIVSVLVLGGIQLFSLGVIGEYVGRSYLNINKKPQFIIKDKV